MEFPKNSKFKKRATEMKNPHHWENLIKDCRKGEDYTNKYNEEVDTLNSFSKKYGSNTLKTLLELTETQWNTNLQTCFKYSFFAVKKPKHARLQITAYAPFIVCKPCLHYNRKLNRICEVTGLDISMQKESNKLSHTGLKHYFKTDGKIYDEVKRKYLSDLWQNADHKTQIKEIAHNISNRHNNLKLQQEKIYKPWQPTLFALATA